MKRGLQLKWRQAVTETFYGKWFLLEAANGGVPWKWLFLNFKNIKITYSLAKTLKNNCKGVHLEWSCRPLPYFKEHLCKTFFKNFMVHFFVDGVQLSQGYKATTRRQFTFYHWLPRNSWYSYDRPRKDERLSQTWSHPVGLNTGPLDWKSSAITTRPLFHYASVLFRYQWLLFEYNKLIHYGFLAQVLSTNVYFPAAVNPGQI